MARELSTEPRPACCHRGGRNVRSPGRPPRTWGSGARSLPHQVAALILRAIEGLVGEGHEAVGAGHPIVGERREADRDREVQRILARIGEVLVHHAVPQPLGEQRRAVQRGLRHHDDELLAAIAVRITVSANWASARVSGGSCPVVRRKNTPTCWSFIEKGSAAAERVGTVMWSRCQRTRSSAYSGSEATSSTSTARPLPSARWISG